MKKFICFLAFSCFISAFVAASSKPFVGMELRKIDSNLSNYLGISGGAFVSKIVKNSPAQKAGIKNHDIIIKWNGKDVNSPKDLANKIKNTTTGKKVQTVLLRKGKKMELVVIPKKVETVSTKVVQKGFLGIMCQKVPDTLREYLQLGDSPGVMVAKVVEDSAAQKAGLRIKDIILKVNGQNTPGMESFLKYMTKTKAGDKVKIEGLRGGKPFKVEAVLGERPAGLSRYPELVPEWKLHKTPNTIKKSRHDQSTLRFKDSTGKEYTIPIPDVFEFKMPDFNFDWPKHLQSSEIDSLKAQVEKALNETRKNLQSQSKVMMEQHHAMLERLRELQEKENGLNSQGKPITRTCSIITKDDGEHEITVKTENGVKTVTVKKGGKTIAKELPYEKLNTLPKEVQKKVKELNNDIKIQSLSIPKLHQKSVKPIKQKLQLQAPSIKL